MSYWTFKIREVKNYQCYKKNKDSFGICIEFRTKLWRDIFKFLGQIFCYCRSKVKKSAFLEKIIFLLENFRSSEKYDENLKYGITPFSGI